MAIKRVKETTPLEQSISLHTPMYSLTKKEEKIFTKLKEEKIHKSLARQSRTLQDLLYTGFVVLLILIMLGIFYFQLVVF